MLGETLELLIREDDENQFRALVGIERNRAFEVILNRRIIIQFVVVTENQIDTEALKFLISEFTANNFDHDDIIQAFEDQPHPAILKTSIHILSRSMITL